MEKEKNMMMIMVMYILKENIQMVKKMEKEKNMMIMVMYILKENIQMVNGGMEKSKYGILKENI